MTRTMLAVLLLSSLAHAQAPAVAPVRPPPVATPGYFPGSTGNPTHTPAGAGASHGGLPGAQKAEVQRSKNWRPGGKGPEVMAPDDAPRASAGPPPSVFGVTLPYPGNASLSEMSVVAMCHHAFSMAEHETQLAAYFANLPPEVRSCLAAKALALCAIGAQDGYNTASDKAALPADMPEALARVREHSLALAAHHCRDVSLEQAVVTAYRKVEKAWYRAAKQTKAPSTSH